MSLKSELEELFRDLAATLPTRRIAAMETALRYVETSSVIDGALKQGELAPDFELQDQNGGMVSLYEVLRDGPVVLSFNRGGWCPFCNLELRAYQKAYPEIQRLGGRLLAVLPQSPARSLEMASRVGLTFSLLSDFECRVAELYGVAFELPESVRDAFIEIDHPFLSYNERKSWKLPLPATYVIDTCRHVAVADVEQHIQFRLEPLDAIAAVRTLVSARVAA